jgi:cytochrome b
MNLSIPLEAVRQLCGGDKMHTITRDEISHTLPTDRAGSPGATHVRVGNPIFTHILFPTYLAALVWGGLMLRDARLRAFVPWRRQS